MLPLATLENGTPYEKLMVVDAIEATAALMVLPTLQVRVAKTETSGTNSYTRQNIDWDKLKEYLQSVVAESLAAAQPGASTTIDSLFIATTGTSLFPDG